METNYSFGTQPRGELVRYEARSQPFLPFLSGISASELDFSSDRQWVTYVTYPDNASGEGMLTVVIGCN